MVISLFETEPMPNENQVGFFNEIVLNSLYQSGSAPLQYMAYSIEHRSLPANPPAGTAR